MNDPSQDFYSDHRGNQRVRRKPQPSSPARLEGWARALHNAYDNRLHVVKVVDDRGTRVKRPEIDFTTLLAKISHQMERETARGGQQGNVLGAIKDTFARESADGAAALRIHILDLSLDGKMTPVEAETWAHRLGLQQIAKRNVRDLCDPMQEAEWSLLMAAVWIQWRDLRLVSRLTLDSTEFFPRWIAVTHEDGSTGYGLDPDKDLEDVKPELRQYLRSGRSKATGFRDGDRREIDAAKWSDLQIVGRYGSDGFAAVMSPDGERDAYQCIRLSRDDLLAAFPPEVEHLDEGVSPAPAEPASSEAAKRTEDYRTGHRGRFSSAPYILTKFLERCEAEAVLARVGDEAKWLSKWFADTHPNAPEQVAQSTVEKIIKTPFRFRDDPRELRVRLAGLKEQKPRK